MSERKQFIMPILCLDFDGVCHSYTSGWKGAAVIPDPAVPGLVAFLRKAVKQFDVQIYSSRSGQEGGIQAMKDWLRYEIEEHFDCPFGGSPNDAASADELFNAIEWPTKKPAAMVTIDDRAITFTGKWPAIQTLKEFQPWNKSKPSLSTSNESRSASPIRNFLTALTAIFRRAQA
jgi:hypothetical protein